MIESSLFAYLENVAIKYPDKTAFTDMNESVTFRELYIRARAIGVTIADNVKSLNKAVAVITNHTVADVAAFYGALYAGCFYVPIDGKAPQKHIQARFEVIKPAMVINPRDFSAKTSDGALDAPYKKILPTDPAYAIFTSGSTGTPKAVVIPHRAVDNVTKWLCNTFDFDDTTIFASQTPFYFDASVTELYCATLVGAAVRIMPDNIFFSPLKVVKFLDDNKVNTLEWATAAMKLLANSGVFNKQAPKYLTNILFGGENMTGKHLNIWKNAVSGARYVNLYGPTETTVDCSYYIINRDFDDNESIPIGKAVSGNELLLFDGELAVRGVGVGLGYYNDFERTSSVFIQNPLNDEYRDIIYLTGDLAEYNEYGELVYIGRKDSQIKHFGTRVELGEIENSACALEGIALSACRYDKENDRIILFFTGNAIEADIAERLSRSLPRYMLPNRVIRLENMPELPNGKIDYRKLESFL